MKKSGKAASEAPLPAAHEKRDATPAVLEALRVGSAARMARAKALAT